MKGAGPLSWYARRLARMSAPEILHRLFEQVRRFSDSRKSFRWKDFGHFGGEVTGLPGLQSERIATFAGQTRDEVERIRARRFVLLNREWPATPDWDSLWHLDPVTGTRWPGRETFAFRSAYRHVGDKGDVKFVWEVNRLQFLPALALAGEGDLVVNVLDSWMRANPPFRGINWTSGIEAASRVVSLLAALQLLDVKTRREFDKPARAFLDAHAFWIARYPSLYSSANNHRIAELAGLFLFGIWAADHPESARLVAQSRLELEQRIQSLFFEDGVGAEQSTTYAAYALEWFALAGIAGDVAGLGFSEASKSRARNAAAYLRHLMDDAGCVPAIGDGDETRVLALGQEPEPRYAASVVALVSRWLDARELAPPSHDIALRDLWGAADDGPQSVISSGRTFEQGGYTVFREPTPQGTLVCVFDHGPLGFESIAAHAHADALSLLLSWGNEPVFVDAGTYLYHSGGKWRDYFRATPVHNTLSLDGMNQSTIAGPFNWSRHARARIVARTPSSIVAEHDGYVSSTGLVHRRSVSFGAGEIVVEDTLAGRANRSISWTLGFTLAPRMRVESKPGAVMLVTPGGRALRVSSEAPLAVETVPYSPAFNSKIETRRISLSGTASAGSGAVARVRIELLPRQGVAR